MLGWVFPGPISTKQQVKCLAQGHNINTVTPPAVKLVLEIFDPQSNILPNEPLHSANSTICTIIKHNFFPFQNYVVFLEELI